MKAKWTRVLPVVFVALFALTRWPGLMPENFSAVYGLAFCAGAFFPRTAAWWVPMVTLVGTDIALCFYYASQGAGDWSRSVLGALVWLAPNYVAYAALIGLGKWITGRARFATLLGGGILGAALFYLISNTGAWLQNPVYPKTLAGWLQALTIGTPGWPHTWSFFLNTLMSGGLFTGLFAGAMKWADAAETESEEDAEESEEEEAPKGEAEPEEAPV